MRLLCLVCFALFLGSHSAHASCVNWIFVDPGRQVEVTVKSVYQSETRLAKARLKMINNNFAFHSVTRHINNGETRRLIGDQIWEEYSLMNVFVDKVDIYFIKNEKKSPIQDSRIYNFSQSFEDISDKFLRRKNFEFESDMTSSSRNGSGKIITDKFKFKYEIRFEPDSHVMVDGCNYDVFVFEKIQTLVDSSAELLKSSLGTSFRNRIFYTKRLMYPLKEQGRNKNGEWVDIRTVTSARIVR